MVIEKVTIFPPFNVEDLFESFKNFKNSKETEPKAPEATKEPEVNIQKEELVPMCVGFYIARLAEKFNWKPEKMARYLRNLKDINPAAAFSVLLKEIAIVLDKQYADHISNCRRFYTISTINGKIYMHFNTLDNKGVNFKNFAAFRTEKDAKIACKILAEDLHEMFGK